MNKEIVILGAGPTGLAASYYYTIHGFSVTVVDKSDSIGGLSKGVNFKGQFYDLGPHSFYANYSKITKDFFTQFFNKDEYEIVKLKKVIQTDQLNFQVPFNLTDIVDMNNLSFFLSHTLHNVILPKFSNSPPRDDRNEKFLNPYCLKYFGLPASEIDAVFESSFYSNQDDSSKNLIYKLKNQCLGDLWERVYQSLKQKKVTFLLGQTLKGIKIKGNRITKLNFEKFEINSNFQVISTIPLTTLNELITPGKELEFPLKYRATILIYIEVKQIKTATFYLTNYDINNPIGRICFASNWKTKQKNKVIIVEVWCNTEDLIYKNTDNELLTKILPILKKEKRVELLNEFERKIIRIPNCFPILRAGIVKEINSVKSNFENIDNLKLCGRHGNFRWDGINESILESNQLLNE